MNFVDHSTEHIKRKRDHDECESSHYNNPSKHHQDNVININKIDFKINPHLEQLKLQQHHNATIFHFEDFNITWFRVLPPNAPRKKYRVIPHELRSVNHWGQRKLLLSEIEFLSKFSANDRLVVYAGAAPGTHIPYLSSLFPDIHFFLVDPADFNCKASDRITIKQEFFTDDTVDELKKQKSEILFISDIRTADPKAMGNEEVESCVQRDMEWQMKWAINLNPIASMHKFRLPWGDGVSQYLGGKIYLPVFGPQTTSESRLIVTNHSPSNMVRYNNREYEEQMFYFNTITRVQYYEHPVQAPGLDHCFDCVSEVIILKDYLHKLQNFQESSKELYKKIRELSEEISDQCSVHGNRCLSTKIDVKQRKSWFVAREYDVSNKKIIEVAPKPLEDRLKQSSSTIIHQPREIKFEKAIESHPSDSINH